MMHNQDELTKQFKIEVHDKLDENIELQEEFQDEDFKSLTVGWAIAKGLSLEDALDFSSYIRYNTTLG